MPYVVKYGESRGKKKKKKAHFSLLSPISISKRDKMDVLGGIDSPFLFPEGPAAADRGYPGPVGGLPALKPPGRRYLFNPT